MSGMGYWAAVLAGGLLLAMAIALRFRQTTGDQTRGLLAPLTLLAAALIIGPLPWALHVGTGSVRSVASSLSVLAAVSSVVLMARWRGGAPRRSGTSPMPAHLFNAEARRVLDLSREASVKRNHEYIGTEHILFGLLASPADTLRALTDRLGLDRASIAARLDAVIQRGKGQVPASIDLPFTSRAKRVLDLAIESAAASGTMDVGPEHLLVGLCAEERGLAAQALAESGITTNTVRAALASIQAAEQ